MEDERVVPIRAGALCSPSPMRLVPQMLCSIFDTKMANSGTLLSDE